MRKIFVLLALVASSYGFCATAPSINVIPKPNKVVTGSGEYIIPTKRPIKVSTPNNGALKIALSELPVKFEIVNSAKADLVLVITDNKNIAKEGYTLVCNKKGVKIEASAFEGLFYGLQTLLQLIENRDGTYVIPYVDIADAPRFGWRGVMLDVARNFFTKEQVMEVIDQIASYKMNKFHWHLTDEQGWRIEIKAYPELVAKGSKRIPRMGDWYVRSEPDPASETAVETGFYTQEDIKQVVAYAAERFVTILPEIDVPGHSTALLFAINDLACMNPPKMVNSGSKYWGIYESSVCVGGKRTFGVLDTIFTEVASLFPCEYIHIGGDECFKGFWAKCPKCTALMAEKNIPDVDHLQSYFVKNLEGMLADKGKKLIGWDEILEGGLAPNATVMSWRGMDGGIAAAKMGHHVIMTPHRLCYLDLYQGEPTAEPATYSMCRLRDSYGFEPVPAGVNPELILGGQANLWAESVPTYRHAQYMLYPRAWAISEVLWSSPEGRDINEFVPRVEAHFARADAADVNYARSMYNPIVNAYKLPDGSVQIALATEFDGMDIYYTFDGTNPDLHSPRYTSPLSIPKDSARIRMRTYRNGKPVGALVSIQMADIRTRAAANKVEKAGNLE